MDPNLIWIDEPVESESVYDNRTIEADAAHTKQKEELNRLKGFQSLIYKYGVSIPKISNITRAKSDSHKDPKQRPFVEWPN
jgi:hypothetical protein